MIASEKGVACTRNHLDLIISASNYYFFRTIMQTFVLKLWQDKEIFQDTNCVEIPVEIQGREISRVWKLNITHNIS